uniref:Uncharacterized protein n=1 Tax=Knipowitschia caucasica TaxID=637954 RepID=A0AAV2J4X1_KNICA
MASLSWRIRAIKEQIGERTDGCCTGKDAGAKTASPGAISLSSVFAVEQVARCCRCNGCNSKQWYRCRAESVPFMSCLKWSNSGLEEGGG